MEKKKVALDAGHWMFVAGKETPVFTDGTVSPETGKAKVKENEFNRAVVKRLDTILKRCGFDTLLTAPDGSKDVPLKARTDTANKAKVDAFISVHYNAFKGVWGTSWSGVGTFYYPTSTSGKKLAEIIQKHLIKGTEQKNRGAKAQNFHVLRETNMVAVLIEAGFMDNPYEAKLMIDESFRDEVAEEIAKGVCEYFGVKYVEPPKPQPQPQPDGYIYRVQVGAFRVKENAERMKKALEDAGFKPYIRADKEVK